MAVLLPHAPIVPFTEQLVWRTQILRGANSSQQRVSLRKVPRQILEYSYIFADDAAVAALDNVLHASIKALWYVPLWGEAAAHHAALALGATTIGLTTAYADWRASGGGAYALLWQSPTKYEIVTVSAVGASALTVSALTQAYAGAKWIVPCRTGYAQGLGRKRRHASGAAVADLAYTVIDNQYISGHAAAQTYDNTDILTDPAGMPSGIYEQSLDPDCWEIDNVTGRRVLRSVSDFPISVQSHEFNHRTRAACWSFRQWLHAINGAQKTFFIPTFRDDLTLALPCLSTDTTITVVNRGYADDLGVNRLREYVAFRSGAGPIIPRRITAVTELSATQERLTLDAAPGTGFAVGANLSWLDRCHLASDVVSIQWYRPDRQRASLSLERVPNFPLILGDSLFGEGVMAG